MSNMRGATPYDQSESSESWRVSVMVNCGPNPAAGHATIEEAGSWVPQGKGMRKRKERKRATLSCQRCHRLKVRCDKKSPCTRCCNSGWGGDCSYTHRTAHDAADYAAQDASHIAVGSDKSPMETTSVLCSQHRGASHWRNLLAKVSQPPLLILTTV